MGDQPELRGEPAAAAAAAGVGVATALATPTMWGRWRRVYQLHMPGSPRRERLFLATVAFGITFALTRAITHAIRRNLGPFHNFSAGGTHLHHLVFGILILLVVGYVSLVEFGGRSTIATVAIRLTAVAYGIGAALTLDEFALWLNLQDVYWQDKGRQSIDAVVVFSSLLAAGVIGQPVIRGIVWEIQAAIRGLSEAERIAHLEMAQMLHSVALGEGEHPQEPVDRAP